VLDGNRAAIPGGECVILPRRAFDERELEAMRVDQRQDLVAEPRLARVDPGAVLLQARAPEAEAAGRHLQAHLDRQPVPEPRRRELGPGEEGEVRARMAFRIRVEKVDGGDVVKPFDALHPVLPEEELICKRAMLRASPSDYR
jgi:hypothetical protein